MNEKPYEFASAEAGEALNQTDIDEDVQEQMKKYLATMNKENPPAST